MPSYRFPAEAGAAPAGGALTAEAVAERLRAVGVHPERLTITVRGDHVALDGPISDATAQECAVVGAGNVRGVARVDDHLRPEKTSGLLHAFGGLAHLPPGAASTEAAEQRVHDAAPDIGDTAFGPAGSLLHTVQPGETLESIAKRHYGLAIEARRIEDTNRGVIAGAGGSIEGLVLRLPRDRISNPR